MAYIKRPPKVTVIRYSCVNGKAVWLYRGQSHEGARKAYQRAAKKEQTRARWTWKRTESERSKNIQHLLDECLAAMPILGDMTKEQRDAVKRLKDIIQRKPERYSDFYKHLQGERRRRDYDRKIRREMKERENQQNHNYDKQQNGQ